MLTNGSAPLVVGEVRGDDGWARRVGRHECIGDHSAARPVIDRFVEAKPTVTSVAGQSSEICSGSRRIKNGCKCSGVRRHDKIVCETALQAESRDTKGSVLIVARAIGERIGRF